MKERAENGIHSILPGWVVHFLWGSYITGAGPPASSLGKQLDLL